MASQNGNRSNDKRERFIIVGAGGKDFHVFNTLFRSNKEAEVVCFTATQIPGIDDRKYPPELSGPLYPDGIQIYPDGQLEELIKRFHADKCILAYSDVSEHDIMELSCRVLVAGATFLELNPYATMLPSSRLVLAVTAVRTGAGKSQVAHYVNSILREHKLKTVLVRHPMPYGDLKAQRVQRFETYDDLKKHDVTIEEREEYEQHLKVGTIVYAGVDYEAILREAEKEADIIIWDGGNNDTPFYKPDLWICVADPHRVGHEITYYPGNINFKAADIIVINKANTAPEENVEELKEHAKERNPRAKVVVTDSVVTVEHPDVIRGKRVVTVDDGPTLTHGGMATGAGKVAAEANNADIVDPRPSFKGSLGYVLRKYPHLGITIPAIGYSPEQLDSLAATINAVDADAVVIATPMDLNRLIDIKKPSTTVSYRIADREGEGALHECIEKFCQKVEQEKGCGRK